MITEYAPHTPKYTKKNFETLSLCGFITLGTMVASMWTFNQITLHPAPIILIWMFLPTIASFTYIFMTWSEK